VLLGVLALAAALLLVLFLDLGGTDDPADQETANDPTGQASPSEQGDRGQGPEDSAEADPTDEAEESPTPDQTDQPDQQAAASEPAAFVDSYYDTVPDDLDAGWAMLSPDYQAEVGRGSYDGFWSTIESVDARNVRTVAGGSAVEATLVFVNSDGQTRTERHRLDVVDEGDGPLIAGDEAI
jgi:hypothetical protein